MMTNPATSKRATSKRATSKRATINPGPGYRLLENSEIVQSGDEYLYRYPDDYSDNWAPCFLTIGVDVPRAIAMHPGFLAIRRKLPVAANLEDLDAGHPCPEIGAGYRMLQRGDDVFPKDEIWLGETCGWVEHGRRDTVACGIFRRKLPVARRKLPIKSAAQAFRELLRPGKFPEGMGEVLSRTPRELWAVYDDRGGIAYVGQTREQVEPHANGGSIVCHKEV